MNDQQNTSKTEPKIYCAAIAASDADSNSVPECNTVQICLTKKQMLKLIHHFEYLEQEHGSSLNVVEVTALKSKGPGQFDLHELVFCYGTSQGFPHSGISDNDIDE